MDVLVLVSAPIQLRGYISRWMSEVAPGVFVGNVNRRIWEELWSVVVRDIQDGHASWTRSYPNEQGYLLRQVRPRKIAVDVEGVILFPKVNSETATGYAIIDEKAKRHREKMAAKLRRR